MVQPGAQAPVEGEKKSRIESLEETVLQLIDVVQEQGKKVDQLTKTTVKKSVGLFGGKREKTAIKDSVTGTIYPSKASVGKALYTLIEGGDSADHFMWYKLQAKFPDRFVEATEEEAKKVWAAEEAKRQVEIEAANKKLAEEEKAKTDAEAKAKAGAKGGKK